MAQMKFGFCLTPNVNTPDLKPPVVGSYTVPPHPRCRDNAERRRRDIGLPQFRDAAPNVTHVGSLDNHIGIASLDQRPRQNVATEQGVITIGYGPIANVGFMPSVQDLMDVPFSDTRATAISDRYYR